MWVVVVAQDDGFHYRTVGPDLSKDVGFAQIFDETQAHVEAGQLARIYGAAYAEPYSEEVEI